MKEDLENKCAILKGAESQRTNEVARGLGHAGTMGFEIMGCYDCDGFKFDCKAYTKSEGRPYGS